MSFYHRKIPYYKFFRLIDTDGDGVKDTITYAPHSNFYYIQFGLDQDVRNIGHYNSGFERPVDVIDFSGIWDDSNDGSNDGYTGHGGSLTPPQGDIISAPNLTFGVIQFCNDPEANNYDPSLIGVAGFTPCTNNTCCTYTQPGQYGTNYGGTTYDSAQTECLVFYTDWGPWNNNLFLNDTSQIYSIKNGCSLTFRLMNLQSVESSDVSGIVPGGWYGASIKIEINNGNGFQTLSPTSPYIQNIGSDIQFSPNGNITLGQKVRIWKAQEGTNPIKYYATKPYRDLILEPPINSQIRITYNNSADPLYLTNYNKLRLQVIKGTPTNPIPSNPTPTIVSTNGSWSWAQNTSTILPLLGTPLERQNGGETFHYINTSNVSTSYNKLNIWERYLSGYDNPTFTVPWGPSGSDIQAGTFYPTQNLNILYDYNRYINASIIQNTTNPSINYNNNPYEVLQDFTFVCTTTQNYISFFDKNGDGFIEYDQNYPNGGNGSVDEGLFSKTRYDSPYIYLKPGTKDNSLALTNNPLTQTSQSQSVAPVSPPSSAGWRNYAYPGSLISNPTQFGFTYTFSNTSPTCQLGGVDSIQNNDVDLTDLSNSSIFLPQSDTFVNSNNLSATFGTGTTVFHTWNYGLTNANGGCCAKTYNSALAITTEGPYLESMCSRCHAQMTTRSAQPVFDNSIKIAMQTTDSDIYYGPFYDPQNPTYNGYGLAFSKANKFCRDVRNKNGVKVITSNSGTTGSALYIGGILHGGAQQNVPNSNITNNYGVEYVALTGFETVNSINSTQSCQANTKLPLKCTKASSSDPNCPSGNCMKCLFCFKCNTEEKQPGIYTGQ
jgi:hypothetical protein